MNVSPADTTAPPSPTGRYEPRASVASSPSTNKVTPSSPWWMATVAPSTLAAIALLTETSSRSPHGAVLSWTSWPASDLAATNSPTAWRSYAVPSKVRKWTSPAAPPHPFVHGGWRRFRALSRFPWSFTASAALFAALPQRRGFFVAAQTAPTSAASPRALGANFRTLICLRVSVDPSIASRSLTAIAASPSGPARTAMLSVVRRWANVSSASSPPSASAPEAKACPKTNVSRTRSPGARSSMNVRSSSNWSPGAMSVAGPSSLPVVLNTTRVGSSRSSSAASPSAPSGSSNASASSSEMSSSTSMRPNPISAPGTGSPSSSTTRPVSPSAGT